MTDDHKDTFQAMSSVPHGSHISWFPVCFGTGTCIGVTAEARDSLAHQTRNVASLFLFKWVMLQKLMSTAMPAAL